MAVNLHPARAQAAEAGGLSTDMEQPLLGHTTRGSCNECRLIPSNDRVLDSPEGLQAI